MNQIAQWSREMVRLVASICLLICGWFPRCRHFVCHPKIIIDREALAKQGDNALGSVRPSFCLCSPAWTVWHMSLIFGNGWRTDRRMDTTKCNYLPASLSYAGDNYFKQFFKCSHSCYERILINGWLLREISIAKHWMCWGWWKSCTELLWRGKGNYSLPVKEDYLHGFLPRWQLGLRSYNLRNAIFKARGPFPKKKKKKKKKIITMS